MDIVVSEDLNGAVKFSSSLPHPSNLNRYGPRPSPPRRVLPVLEMDVRADILVALTSGHPAVAGTWHSLSQC